jgi:adenosylmethionine-8-amino-7-oxononanoate aminotransferase
VKRSASRTRRGVADRSRRRRPSGRARALPGHRSRRDAARRSARRAAAERGRREGGAPEPEAPAASDPAEQALAEATEIGLLLDDGEHEPEPAEEEDVYFRTRHRNPALPRVRPAPDIVSRRRGAGKGEVAARAARAADAHLFPRNLLTPYPIAARAAGIRIHDAAGREYLDACGGAAVCSIGHGVEEIAAVMSRQARRLAFVHSSQFVTRESMGLAARIAALAPGGLRRSGRIYLASGGSEAVETAIKLARQYHVDAGRPSRTKIVGRWQSYHGSTMGALAATGNVARRALYEPLFAAMPHAAPCYCYRCPYGLKFPSCRVACVDDLETIIRQEGPDTVAAFIAEPIVGATLGAVAAVEGYWQRAREICSRYGVLLIADEVMTGVGRTGRNFAVDHERVVPDMIVAGKGLSGGYAPLGAVIASAAIHDTIRGGRGYFEHGFTYSANPLSAAVGSAVLDYISRNRLIPRAARLGRVLGERLDGLRRHRIVGDVRGRGMLWGIELVRDRKSREPFAPALKVARRVYQAGLEEGILIYPGTGSRSGQDGDHFLVAPAFTITAAEIEELVARLDRTLGKVAASLR